MLEVQYLNSPPEIQDLLRPVRGKNCTTYRYIHADSIKQPERDGLDQVFVDDVEIFCKLLEDANTEVDEYYLFELDVEEEDIDYVIGVCYTGLQSMFVTDAQLRVEYQFGNFWAVEVLWST